MSVYHAWTEGQSMYVWVEPHLTHLVEMIVRDVTDFPANDMHYELVENPTNSQIREAKENARMFYDLDEDDEDEA